MLVTLKEISQASFHLIGMNGFHIEAENERFSLVCRVAVGTSNLISRRRLADYVEKWH